MGAALVSMEHWPVVGSANQYPFVVPGCAAAAWPHFHFLDAPADQVITDEMKAADEAALDVLAQQLEPPPADESWLRLQPVSGRRRGRHRR